MCVHLSSSINNTNVHNMVFVFIYSTYGNITLCNHVMDSNYIEMVENFEGALFIEVDSKNGFSTSDFVLESKLCINYMPHPNFNR